MKRMKHLTTTLCIAIASTIAFGVQAADRYVLDTDTDTDIVPIHGTSVAFLEKYFGEQQMQDLMQDLRSNRCLDQHQPCSTIGHALEMAEDGDVIKVAAGEYNHNGFKSGVYGINLIATSWTSKRNLVVEGRWTNTFTHRLPRNLSDERWATIVRGSHSFRAVAFGVIDITFDQIDFRSYWFADNDLPGTALTLESESGGYLELALKDSTIDRTNPEWGLAIDAVVSGQASELVLNVEGVEISGPSTRFWPIPDATTGTISASCLSCDQMTLNLERIDLYEPVEGPAAVDIYTEGTGATTIIHLKRNRIHGNYSGGGVSVESVYGGRTVLHSENNFITGNRGQGVYLDSSAGPARDPWEVGEDLSGSITAWFVHDTIADNGYPDESDPDGVLGYEGMLFVGFDTTVFLTNSIVWGNWGWDVQAVQCASVITLDSDVEQYSADSCSTYTPQGNNLSVDPLFADPEGNEGRPDYHLTSSSPVIDMAWCAQFDDVRLDFDGTLRWMWICHQVDMGADEYSTYPPVIGTPAELSMGLTSGSSIPFGHSW